MDTNRRRVAKLLATGFASGLACQVCAQDFPTSDSRAEISKARKEYKAKQGGVEAGSGAFACSDFSAFADSGGAPGGLSVRSGIDWLDHRLSQELGILWRIFQLQPAVFFFDDGDAGNAMATPQNVGSHRFPHGTVLIGRTLTSDLLTHYAGRSPISSGDHALGAVVAHEWAHIAQFSRGQRMPWKAPELHADFMAGWYMAGRAVSSGAIVNFEEAAEELFNRGDFAFNSPQHHGMPHERVAAYVAGVGSAARGVLRTLDAFNLGIRYVSSAN